MILDNALAKSRVLGDFNRKILTRLKPITHRYVFNSDASRKVGRFAYYCADIVCREAEMVMTPFPNVYIEINNRAKVEATNSPLSPDSVDKVGIWFTELGSCFFCFGDERDAEFDPWIYSKHGSPLASPSKPKDFYKADGSLESYMQFKEMLLLGNVGPDLKKDEFKHGLLDNYEIGLTHDKIPSKLLNVMFNESIGDFKYALAALLLLDARSQRKIIPMQATRHIVNGKLKAFAAHDVITIDLDVPSIRHVYTHHIGHHASPVEHEVAGHWVHYNCSTQCKHHWMELHSEHAEKQDIKKHKRVLERQICTLCGGYRTRKLNYVKGDPSKGSRVGLTKYKVIASKEPKT